MAMGDKPVFPLFVHVYDRSFLGLAGGEDFVQTVGSRVGVRGTYALVEPVLVHFLSLLAIDS